MLILFELFFLLKRSFFICCLLIVRDLICVFWRRRNKRVCSDKASHTPTSTDTLRHPHNHISDIHTSTQTHTLTADDEKGMSLAQHVTATEGFDREIPAHDHSHHPAWQHPQHSHSQAYSTTRSVRRVLSYDAFPPLEREVTLKEEHGGVTPYHVSLVKRIGMLIFSRHFHESKN